VIRPPGRWPALGLSEAWRFRSICLVLTRRSLMVRYRQTVLGAAWTIIQPLLLMIVFSVFFGLLGRMPSQGIVWPVFYFLGLLPWHMVSRIVSEGSGSIVTNGQLLNRVYFPRVYFPTATALSSIVDFLFGFVALGVILLIFRVVPGWGVILVPLLMAIGISAGLGVALWLSALNAAYRDIAQLLPSLTQIWFFASPIIYPVTIIPEEFRTAYYFNPMTVVVEGFRWAFAGTPAPRIEGFVIGGAVAVTLLVTGYVFFRKREPLFADVV
jgi:lipopolysaccharide transport system permease protein